MNVVFRSSRSFIATLLALGLSTPLALAAANRGNGNTDKKVNKANQALAQGREERAEKRGVEGREERAVGKNRGSEERAEKKGVEGKEERTLGKGMGREERTEKKGVEGREERAKRHRHHGRAAMRSHNGRQR
jgi:hypothetical protein